MQQEDLGFKGQLGANLLQHRVENLRLRDRDDHVPGPERLTGLRVRRRERAVRGNREHLGSLLQPFTTEWGWGWGWVIE